MASGYTDERDVKGFKRVWIDYSVEVDASTTEVHALLSDIAGWPGWSPGVRAVRHRGRTFRKGSRFWLVLDLPGVPVPAALPCTVTHLDASRIEWGGGVPGSRIRHRFELSALPGGGTRVRHVEYATQLLALLALPIERLAHAHDRRWSDAIRAQFARG